MIVLLWHSIQGLYDNKRVNFVSVIAGLDDVDGAWLWPKRGRKHALHTLMGVGMGKQNSVNPSWKNGGQSVNYSTFSSTFYISNKVM